MLSQAVSCEDKLASYIIGLVVAFFRQAEAQSGGYDYEFVDEVPSKYICCICTKVLREARLAECCGQHFCHSCLTQWFSSNSKKICPHCRTPRFQHVLNKEKIREIKKLRIRCSNVKKGCKWESELGDIKHHLESESGCQFVIVKCSNDAYKCFSTALQHLVCGVEIERQHLATHKENDCEYRRCTCQYCGYVDIHDAITGSGTLKKKDSNVKGFGNHHSTCEKFPLKCVNECGKEDIKREDMQSHRNVCPLEKTKCPFHVCCRADILRQDMESHKKECDFRPHSCKYCGHVGAFYTMSGRGKSRRLKVNPSHYEVCKYYPLDCINGCGEMRIKRKDMSAHCNTCPLQPLDCPLGTHQRKILQRDMELHKAEECEFRPYRCMYCNEYGTYVSITGKGASIRNKKCHYDLCSQYPLECPNRCGETNIKRRNMSLHRQKCPREQLDCPFKFAGCVIPILREDMDYHCQHEMQNHLLLVAKSHQELARKCEELARKNDKLESEIEKLTKKNTIPDTAAAIRIRRTRRSRIDLGATPTSHYDAEDSTHYDAEDSTHYDAEDSTHNDDEDWWW